MGLLSWMTGGGAPPPSAASAAAPSAAPSAGRPRANPWSRLYDPGTPPVRERMEGASATDSGAKSVWECVLQSESFRRRSFDSIDAGGDGHISTAELAAAVGPSCSPAQAEALVKAADRDGDGRISRREFAAVMDTHFGSA